MKETVSVSLTATYWAIQSSSGLTWNLGQNTITLKEDTELQKLAQNENKVLKTFYCYPFWYNI